jgi:hypothetical protein
VGDSIKGWHLRQKVEWTSLWELDSAWPFSWEVFLVARMVQNPPAMGETRVPSLGWEDLLEEGMATRSSILFWRIPRTEKPGWWATVHRITKSQDMSEATSHARTGRIFYRAVSIVADVFVR